MDYSPEDLDSDVAHLESLTKMMKSITSLPVASEPSGVLSTEEVSSEPDPNDAPSKEETRLNEEELLKDEMVVHELAPPKVMKRISKPAGEDTTLWGRTIPVHPKTIEVPELRKVKKVTPPLRRMSRRKRQPKPETNCPDKRISSLLPPPPEPEGKDDEKSVSTDKVETPPASNSLRSAHVLALLAPGIRASRALKTIQSMNTTK
eukprot:TRINITY_DN5482_c0_g1_i1.p1 TRINITY_DN5482_c0_g1~~TRINITY_DN5482_c0_g1_i1.p1  ORF type:complete len:205 (-),score=37.60 TRINITY_DN5482_c0_g1_i1:15-629(-)